MKEMKALDYAFFLLKLRDRSTGELRFKMKQKKFSDSQIQETIDFLRQQNFIDDARFASNYVRYQTRLKPQGKYQLKVKLLRLYVPEDIIAEALGSLDSNMESSLALEAAKKWSSRKRTTAENDKEKLARYLVGRGFGWEVIKETISKLSK